MAGFVAGVLRCLVCASIREIQSARIVALPPTLRGMYCSLPYIVDAYSVMARSSGFDLQLVACGGEHRPVDDHAPLVRGNFHKQTLILL